MKTLPVICTILSLATLTGCVSGFGEQPTRLNPSYSSTAGSNGQTQTNKAAPKSIQVYNLNEAAAAGEIVHTVTSAEKLDMIPATSTIPTYDLIAVDSPAADGFVWLHVEGNVTNNSKKSQTVNSLSFTVVDANGNAYEPVTADTILYVEENKVPVALSLQPTQTLEWETYFLVPKEAQQLQLRATDLAYLPENSALIDLGL